MVILSEKHDESECSIVCDELQGIIKLTSKTKYFQWGLSTEAWSTDFYLGRASWHL